MCVCRQSEHVSPCVPAALHPCRHANLLAASHSSFPEKRGGIQVATHDAPLPSRRLRSPLVTKQGIFFRLKIAFSFQSSFRFTNKNPTLI